MPSSSRAPAATANCSTTSAPRSAPATRCRRQRQRQDQPAAHALRAGLSVRRRGALGRARHSLAARGIRQPDALPRSTNGVKDDLAAWEDLVVATTLGGQPVTREAAYQALEQLGLGQAADLPKRALSPGQRKRVALARLQLGTRQRLWILDEPFTALEHAAVDALCATINGHLAQGGVVVYTTHQEIALDAGRMMRLDLALPC